MSKLKKPLSIVLAALMLISVFAVVPISASANDDDYDYHDDYEDYYGSDNIICGDYEYKKLKDGTISIEKYNGPEEEEEKIKIPSELDGKKVTAIGDNAFDSKWWIIEVVIPDGVKLIGEQAFSNGNIKKVTFPDSVTRICDEAFYKNESLTSVKLPDGVTSIGTAAFDTCESLESINIPDGVTRIESKTFYRCKSLKSITIPEGVKSIGDEAFGYCDTLKGVTIPRNVESIGNSPFLESESLISINVDSNNTNYCSVDGILYNKDKTELIQYPIGKEDESFTVPESVTSILRYAFSRCDNLQSVKISDGVKSIGEGAFWACDNLYNITIPDRVINIEKEAFEFTAFYNADSNWDKGVVLYIGKHLIVANGGVLSSYSVKEGTITLAEYAFYNCKYILSVELPDSVANISKSAFEASGVTSVNIPNSVTSIGRAAFHECNNLTSITIPDGVTNIDAHAFQNCKSLTSIRIADSVTSIGENAFLCTAFYDDYSNWEDGVLYIDHHLISANYINYDDDTDNYISGEYVIKSGTKTIAYHAFAEHRLTSLTFPDSVENIGEWALDSFYGKHTLSTVTIGKGVKRIGFGAFCNLIDYNQLIYTGDFTDDYTLKDVYYNGSKADWEKIEIGEFNASLANATIHFTDGSSIETSTDESVTQEPSYPIATDPITTEPPVTSPVTTEPVDTTPVSTNPVATEPDATNPVATEPEATTPPAANPTNPPMDKINSLLSKLLSEKDTNPIEVTAKTKTIKAKKLKKKAQKIKALSVEYAEGKVTYKLVKSGISKKIRKLCKINSKGVITIKKWKKAKKGTYKIKVKVTAAGNRHYKAKKITKTVKVKIK